MVNTNNGLAPLWVTGAPYRVLAVDGTDLNAPGEVEGEKYGLPAGGRVDLGITVPPGGVRVDFAGTTTLVLGEDPENGEQPQAPDEFVDLLSYGEPADLGLDPEQADRRFEYRIGKRPGFLDGVPGMWWSINGHLFPDVPMFMVTEGDVVVMEIDNGSDDAHPMHLHGHHAVVLSRDGEPATGSPVVGRLAGGRRRRDVRDRVRRGQPGSLDGPLPQPAARRGGAGRAPDVHGRRVVVPRRRRRREPAGVARFSSSVSRPGSG